MSMNHMNSYQNVADTKIRLGRLMILMGVAFLIGFAAGFAAGCASGYALKTHITVKYDAEMNKPINYQEGIQSPNMTEME